MEFFKKEYDEMLSSNSFLSEEKLEKAFIYFLASKNKFNYRPDIKKESQLKNNFRKRIEELNKYNFSDEEFERKWIIFNSGNAFQKGLKLKIDQIKIKKDGKFERTLQYFDFINIENNKFEIINQLETKDKKEGNRRFDVNILINGIPMIHIELKRQDKDVHEAANQIKAYKMNKSISGFLDFTKIFIFSNNTISYYMANNNLEKFNPDFAFKWSDKNNNILSKLIGEEECFSSSFLNKKTILSFIENYFVYDKNEELVKILRPYQYHACNEVLKRIESDDNASGYIWHATGSGKTLTSFKVCELLTNNQKIKRTIFLIDRKDLNTQTYKNFKKFTTKKSLIKNVLDKNDLIETLIDPKSDKKIIITTIQKLNFALKEKNDKLNFLKNENVLFVVDECHRSQLGIMRKNIDKFFKKSINLAFTGTPIFSENATDGKTTEDIFGSLIHKYTSKSAIEDQNVLPITFKYSESIRTNDENIKESYDDDLYENLGENIIIDSGRIESIVKYIDDNYDKNTRDKYFNAMLACSSIPEAIEYYNQFKSITQLRIKILFSVNNSDYSSNSKISNSSLIFMEERIKEHNKSWTIKEIEKYKTDIQDEFSDDKNKKIDLLIVVSMLLTGFDSPITNTLYLDKNLRYQGLVQAISRTNRLYEGKGTGNVISFKTSRETLDIALRLYTNGDSDKASSDIWKVLDFNTIKDEFQFLINIFIQKFKSPSFVTNLKSETEQIEFLDSFKKIIKKYNEIKPLTDFDWNDIQNMNPNEYSMFMGIYRTYLNIAKEKNIILVYNDYEIVDLETIVINSDYFDQLSNRLLDLIKDSQNEDFRDQESFQKIRDEIINKTTNENDRDILSGFVELDSLQNAKTFDDIKRIWIKYIKEIIEKTSQNAIKDWSATTKIIDELVEHYRLKKEYDTFFSEEKLDKYLTNRLRDDLKHENIKQILKKLIVLEDIFMQATNS